MKMKIGCVLLACFLGVGCTTRPYEELQLDTTSNFKVPTEGRAGIYVYQWKSGLFGAAADVEFEIIGGPKLSLNTGEFGYVEVEPGDYRYKILGGPRPQYAPLKLERNKNYFFRSYLSYGMDTSSIVTSQSEIDDAKKNILSGRYEYHTVD